MKLKKMYGYMNINGILPFGKIFWISPEGDKRVLVEGCGWQFTHNELNPIWIYVDISDLEG